MKFQIPNIHHSKVNRRTHAHTDRQTDRQAESNMPFQLFQSWGHKNAEEKEKFGRLLCCHLERSVHPTVWLCEKKNVSISTTFVCPLNVGNFLENDTSLLTHKHAVCRRLLRDRRTNF